MLKMDGIPDGVHRRFRPPEPRKLVNSEYRNWPDYMDKFGFCSLGPVKHPVAAAFYIDTTPQPKTARDASSSGGNMV